MAVSKIQPVQTGTVVAAVEEWLDDNISGGQTIAIDDTLTVEHAGADAKATGTRITALENGLSGLATVSGTTLVITT